MLVGTAGRCSEAGFVVCEVALGQLWLFSTTKLVQFSPANPSVSAPCRALHHSHRHHWYITYHFVHLCVCSARGWTSRAYLAAESYERWAFQVISDVSKWIRQFGSSSPTFIFTSVKPQHVCRCVGNWQLPSDIYLRGEQASATSHNTVSSINSDFCKALSKEANKVFIFSNVPTVPLRSAPC